MTFPKRSKLKYNTYTTVLIIPGKKYLKGNKTLPIPHNPVKAIRLACLDCCGGYRKEVRECSSPCPLHPFRLGSNPFRKPTPPPKNQIQQILAER